ncbi:MAG: DUF5615 family PIN-like protein [Gemmatimonadales bacterium]|nr:DUF5615 family PIN-like protein [Gemmatimonadales bacterium]MDZ4389920.1 DUF5615 family PIN-like protein [Gemmatimonadales bacterium]
MTKRRWPDVVYGLDDSEAVIRALDAASAAAADVPSAACNHLVLLIDECVTPLLRLVAHEFGYEAHFIHHRGWGGLKDPQLLKKLLSDDLTIVTNNYSDWVGLLGDSDLHPGLIVILENAPRSIELEHFTRVMLHVAGLSSLVNTAVEVGPDGHVESYPLPQ